MRWANVPVFVPHLGCPNDCSFCNQRVISGASDASGAGQPVTPDGVRRLLCDAKAQLAAGTNEASSRKTKPHAQIAFFGGSFTAIDRTLMTALLAAAVPFVEDGSFAGIRVSTRPDAIDADVLDVLRRHHVTDIELGAQSLDDSVLAANRRGHSAAQIAHAAQIVRAGGFALGMQMMTGLYRDTAAMSRETARGIIALKPDYVRIYPTVVLRGTYLETLMQTGQYEPQGLDEAVALCAELLLLFAAAEIPVIRLGLHDGEGLATGYVAGAYHPAFRELCEGEIMLGRLEAAIQRTGVEAGAITALVHPSCISRMAGQNRRNIGALCEKGYRVKIKSDEQVGFLDVRLSVDYRNG